MKKFYKSIILLFIPLVTLAQKAPYEVKLKTGSFNPILNFNPGIKAEIQPALYNHQYFILATFSELPGAAQQKQLASLGIFLEQYLGGSTYFTTINESSNFSLLPNYKIAGLNILPAKYKIDPQSTAIADKTAPSTIAVSFSKAISRVEAGTIFQKEGAVLVHTKFDTEGLLFIRVSQEKLAHIAALPFILYMNPQVITDRPVNYNNNAAHGNDALSYSGIGGRGLTGKNITVGVGDNSDVSTHIDFAGRLINRNPTTVTLHGTHTMGTTGGAGILNVKYKGMAPGSTIISQLFSDVIINAPTLITDYNLTLTNNSYFDGNPGCAGEGVYDVLSNYGDQQQRSYSQLLHVFAAGNDGGGACTPFPFSYGTIKSGWQCAKNVLTVGAFDNANNSIAFFSSRGPVQDGRLKPEVVAGGVSVTSTYPYNTYGSSSGTSMATPTVTGSIALLSQRFKQLNAGANPGNALLKALVCNTAEDMGNPGPDFTYGFGKLNTRRAVEALESGRYEINSINNSSNNAHTVTVPAGSKQVKILLYWNDKEASAGAGTALINDLDLTVTEPNLTLHLPLTLSSAPASVSNTAIEGVDHLNNIEQVVINNPPAGNYSVNVHGFSVPFGPQEYILTYEIINPSVFLEYPFGGETWVPGEIETIRWSASDPDTNPFTLEYSLDNGGSWVTIDNNISAIQRTYGWVVPSTFSNTTLIRITRNSTSFSDQSHFNFTILGQPGLVVTLPCPTYAQIDWPLVTGATSYDVLLLDNDTMKIVANTTSNSYLLSGLDPAKSYWVSVTAKNGTTSGRRSLATNFTPRLGVCTLTTFDNDLIVDSIIEPVNGRQFTTTSPLPVKPIKIKIRNLDDVASAGLFTVSYSINGAAPVTETESSNIPAGGYLVHTFAQQATGAGPFVDSIKVWVTKGTDTHHENDTASTIVKLLSNPVLTLPLTEGFETAVNKEYDKNTNGLDGLDNIDLQVSTTRGRARPFVNTGFAHSGTRAITLDQAPADPSSNADSMFLTGNLSSYSLPANLLRLDFYYKNQGQPNLPGNKVWIRGSDTSVWLEAYDLYANQGNIGAYKLARAININDILSSATPQQNVTSSFQVKFGEEGYTSANTPYPESDEDDGYTFDDITISEAINDIGLIQVISPSLAGCGLSSSVPISIRVRNYAGTSANNIQVNYRVNGGPVVTENIPLINANQTLNYTFATTANLAAYIDYSLDIWVKYIGDNYPNNDSIINYSFHNSPLINTFPYLERFEASDGNWYSKGTNSSWQWGVPAGTIINKAPNGAKAWVTNLTGNYNDNELSYLYSPCFDLSGMTQPVLSFSHIFKMEDNCDCDYHWIEYSPDGGISWQKLGAVGSGTNWYDNAVYQRWQASNTKWHVSSIDLPVSLSIIRFRFVVFSDGATNFEGVGVDDIHVFDKAKIYSGSDVTGITLPVSGTNWINFSVGGDRVVSINPNGQNLGATSVDVHFNSGPVRISNNQYYLDRNIVIRVSNQPSQYVGVRYYFTNIEANRLISATGCGSCTTIKDAYEAGVTKYSGTALDENGTLADDSLGFFQFIDPINVDIIPYDNGYYAEFGVNTFSEFWINNGGANGISPLPVTLLNFDATKDGDHSKLTWTTSQEINSDKFIVERSGNDIDFINIGSVAAKGNSSSTSQYQYIDNQPLNGVNYYRLKIVELNSANRHSIVRKVVFGKVANNIVYPNPVSNGVLFIQTSDNCKLVELFDITGKLLNTFSTMGIINQLNIGKLPAGIYQLRIHTSINVETKKIVVK